RRLGQASAALQLPARGDAAGPASATRRETVMTANEIIELLQLQPLPLEGGYYRETYRSAQRLPGGKSAATAIYYLLTPDTCSALHRLPADEVYHFYLGDAVELLLLGAGGEIVTLGTDLL